MSRLRPPLALGARLGFRLGFCLAVASVLASPAAVAATPSALDTALDYQADADCPGRDRFFALLDRAVDPPERSRLSPAPGLRIRVEIRAGAGGYRGSMEKVDRSGSSAPRVVVSPICAEVAQALALTAAFSLAPDATGPDPVDPTLVARSDPGPSAQRASGGGGDIAGPWLGAIGAGVGGWLSTDTLTGIEGSGGRAFPIGVAALPFTATVRLRTTYARNDWAGNSPVARFALLMGALEACALSRPFAGGFEVGLCASGESGWLRGRGVRIANPRASDSLWLAFGGGPLVRVPLAGRWQIEARGAVVRPLRRVQFAFEAPDQPVGETPAVTWIAALAVVARFP